MNKAVASSPHSGDLSAAGELPKAFLVQMGARRNYELARMLELRAALAALQTDAAWPVGSVNNKLLRRILPRYHAALERRTVRGVPTKSIRTTWLPNLAGVLMRSAGLNVERRYRIEDRLLGLSARLRGLEDANIVLNTNGNGGERFLRWAKSQGLKIASDIVLTPLAYEIVAREQYRWPCWDSVKSDTETISRYQAHIEAVVSVSDVLLCPSATVIDGLKHIPGFDPKKVALVPYAHRYVANRRSNPHHKRILFAGQISLRKGIPYLAQAATILRSSDPNVEVRVAGGDPKILRERPECRNLSFLGQLSSAAMEDEFSRADVFCLPSLAEGSARVVLEAMSYGIPCVVTPAAGSPIEDRVQGLVVPERDGEELARALNQLIYDRDLRDRLGTAAQVKVQEHSLDAVGGLLFHALRACLDGNSVEPLGASRGRFI